VTFTETVHWVCAANVPPASSRLDPAVGKATPPPQVLVNPVGLATTMFAGRVSMKPIPVIVTRLLLLMPIVK
jgi:hypothetical protein